MTIIQYISLYALTAIVFFGIDIVWLGVVAQQFYQKTLGHLMGAVNWSAAIVFYLLYIVGILIFATLPALQKGQWTQALLYGALFGFFCYATYDLSNLATLKDWPIVVVVVDIIWGAVLTGTVATAAFFIGKWIS